MSFLAKLSMDGEEYTVLEFDLGFTQNKDGLGKPEDVVRGGSFRVVIESDRNTGFLAWMLAHSELKDGEVIFYRRDAMSRMKEVRFTKAYCTDYKESFRSTADTPMKIELEITAKDIDFSGAKYERPWTLEA